MRWIRSAGPYGPRIVFCSIALYVTSFARLCQSYSGCETCSGDEWFYVKGLSQGLAQVSKGWTLAEIYSCAYRFAVSKERDVFASMIGAGIGGVYTVIGGEEDSIIRLHHLLHLSEPGIYV